jgi:beta-galactosidase
MHHRILAALAAVVCATHGAELEFNHGWTFHRVEASVAAAPFQPDPADLLAQGAFPPGSAAQRAQFKPASGRYVCLQALSSQKSGEPFTSLAEFELLDAQQQPLPRTGWRVLFADGAEDNQPASAVLDGQPDTIWHTPWRQSRPAHPHTLVIDLGAVRHGIAGLRLLPRQENTPGIIKDWRLYLRSTPWQIPGTVDETFDVVAADDAAWERVCLPHTPRIEAASVQFPFQGLCGYRKTFAADPAWRGRKVFLEFGAAMQIADVWVNGQHKVRHLGGYLPFTLDLTDDLRFDVPNVVAVRLDNRDTQECPPGKPLAGLDFSYFGGLYRGARLLITQPLHVSDPLRANCVAGGGIFIRSENVSATNASVLVQTHVLNEGTQLIGSCVVRSVIAGPDGAVVAEGQSLPVMIPAGGGHNLQQRFEIRQPQLWHPDHPWLYRLTTTVLSGVTPTDGAVTRFGIKRIDLGTRLLVNGAEFHLRGSNRHQEYPWLGNALSPDASRRDAQKIKDGGFNCVRLSHYPQDPAFLEACDEQGIFVQAAIPGWQQFWPTSGFAAEGFQNIRELIRRDRNHACILFWEPNLNETHGTDYAHWQRAAHEIAHAEYPGDQCFTFGDGYPPKVGWNWDVRGMWREYGDWNFGGNESTSRHTRGEGEAALLQQTWNFLWTFNHINATYAEPQRVLYGSATWVMFDYNRGYYVKPCTCGMMDIYRLPKYVYYFYQSQREVDHGGAVVFIANGWTARPSPAKVVVFSNGDEVELLLNGKALARQRPDAGPDTAYAPKKKVNLATVGSDTDKSGGNPFDGGNCRNLAHPPFTFAAVPFAAGELKAVAYRAGKPIAEHSVRTPGKPATLKLEFDTAGRSLVANGADAIFVRASVLDANGTIVPEAHDIAFECAGPATLIGPNPASAEAGIASLLLRAGEQPGPITLTVRAPGLENARATISSVPAER